MANDVVTAIFGKDVFNDEAMKQYLPKGTYETLMKIIEDEAELDPITAGVVAHGMKEWALERGATHFTHWFQPMTDITAEKHDSFIRPAEKGRVIMEFSGKELIKGESDASSFPSGGLRAVFEARGYTAWDCTSPAFLKEDGAGVTLCIPTVFCSYSGEALDKKTPLLRSLEAINKQVLRALKLFGHNDVKKVTCSVGPEQEYFLVNHDSFMKREDLVFTGRTLFGAMPPKGQELDDHYFGTLKERVSSYMKELNQELWKLGILTKTQHNEAAPAQHENAPIYSQANISTDHNQLTMEIMKKVAKRHGLECLLHEKPFMGVNGSGKHNNWSICTDTNKNLFDPGKTPHENLQFLFFLSAVIKAVDENALLLRLSASNPGNDHRLGGHEAPPAIVSIFLGDQLEDIVNQIIENGVAKTSKQGGTLNTGVHSLPKIFKDATDRNRTSPFAFTGNKFEFRMVASSVSIATCNTVINTIVADAIEEMTEKLEDAKDFDSAVRELIQETLKKHSRVIFGGNGYSKEWQEEAKKRGLPNAKSFVDAIESLTSNKTIEIFRRQNVLSKIELESRSEIHYEAYAKVTNIEAKTMIDMFNRQYQPAIISYITTLADSVNKVKKCGIDSTVQEKLLERCTDLLNKAAKANEELNSLVDEAKDINNLQEKAFFFNRKVVQKMEELRTPVDKLEEIVDKKIWPVPTYRELLFEV